MSLDTNSLTVSASIGYAQTRANSGSFPAAKQAATSLSFSVRPSTVTYQEILVAEYAILAAGTQTIDLSSFTTLLFESITTVNKVLGFQFTATGNTGQLKIEPGASNPLTWFFSGTTPAITLECGTGGCSIQIMDGVAETVDGTHKTIKLSNPGSATITVNVAIIVGKP